jgi:hypothetical protein
MAKRKPEPSKALMRTFDVLLKPTDPTPSPATGSPTRTANCVAWPWPKD